jgi:hypothetical protein
MTLRQMHQDINLTPELANRLIKLIETLLEAKKYFRKAG